MNDPRLAEIFDVSKIMDIEPERDLLLQTRETTHGSFDENARVWQLFCDEANRTQFCNDRQRLAYNMICLKLARLLQHPEVQDHWDDIAGYAKLGSEGCE
jgi:hypothetical protein